MPCQGRRILNPVRLPFRHFGLCWNHNDFRKLFKLTDRARRGAGFPACLREESMKNREKIPACPTEGEAPTSPQDR